MGGTVVFAVERLARKGRRSASGKRGDWEEDWMKVRRIIGASIFFCPGRFFLVHWTLMLHPATFCIINYPSNQYLTAVR